MYIIHKLRNKAVYIVYKILNVFVYLVYKLLPFRNAINMSEERTRKIIVSFTSYPKRFAAIPLTVKTILYQSYKPDKIILYLASEECKGKLPKDLYKLEKYGLEIVFVDDNLKPHKKYFYSMQEYPHDIIITIDDDILYPRNLIKRLYKSYEVHPDCISAARVHQIKIIDGKLCKYNEWYWEYRKKRIPSDRLFATSGGGTLYPPHILPEQTFDSRLIKELCLGADDVWLKFMELMGDKKVVYVPGANRHIWNNGKYFQDGLSKLNCDLERNDEYIEKVSAFFNISIPIKIGEEKK
ncbi:MAG: hypothetical protein NC489_35360 [Ruminococcus flavefaciens]|nr:hypothetical protein [Ruminococcus flavefaciens]